MSFTGEAGRQMQREENCRCRHVRRQRRDGHEQRLGCNAQSFRLDGAETFRHHNSETKPEQQVSRFKIEPEQHRKVSCPPGRTMISVVNVRHVRLLTISANGTSFRTVCQAWQHWVRSQGQATTRRPRRVPHVRGFLWSGVMGSREACRGCSRSSNPWRPGHLFRRGWQPKELQPCMPSPSMT